MKGEGIKKELTAHLMFGQNKGLSSYETPLHEVPNEVPKTLRSLAVIR
jgi:hypothetical protein